MTDRSVSARVSHQDRVGTAMPPRTSPLHETLNAAGGQTVERCGTLVVRDFGSAASEAAVCQRAVGIADRSDLVKLELRGRQARLLELIEQLTRARPDVGSALATTTDHAWWCMVAPERVLVLGDACQASRILRVIELAANRGAVTLADASQTLAAIAVVGPRAAGLLGAASDFADGEPPTTERLATVPIGGQEAIVVRQGPIEFLAVVEAASAVDIWDALHRAGQGLGVGWVGHEAIEHLAISARMSARRSRA